MLSISYPPGTDAKAEEAKLRSHIKKFSLGRPYRIWRTGSGLVVSSDGGTLSSIRIALVQEYNCATL